MRYIQAMKVLIIDDHPVFRDGLTSLLQQSELETVVLQAGDLMQAMTIVGQEVDLDVVLLDLIMPGTSGVSAIADISRARPDLPIIVLSASEDPRDARKALAQGALGYVPKSAGQQTLLSAIRLVLNGDLYVPPLILEEAATSRLAHAQRQAADSRSALTERQISVLQRLGEGQSNKMIALDLDLSEKTVKAHVTAIFKALNVVSRTQAAAVARELGLI
jgi:DNA-binding NarL/FixJ family response regulator